MNAILEDFLITTADERLESGVEVPYKGLEFMQWLTKKGYKDTTRHRYFKHLIDLDKFVVTRVMPQFDIYAELPKVCEEQDILKFHNLCKQYERPINDYMLILKNGLVEDTKVSAEYDDMSKLRSAWRKYCQFLYSQLNGTIDEVVANNCIIPYTDEFIEYIQETSQSSDSTAKSYISRLRSMNDKYLSCLVTSDKLPFASSDFDRSVEVSEMLDNLSASIVLIEENLAKENDPKIINTLKRYLLASRHYIKFLNHK